MPVLPWQNAAVLLETLAEIFLISSLEEIAKRTWQFDEVDLGIGPHAIFSRRG